MATNGKVDVRRELGRLILDGLRGRTLKQLFAQLRAAFAAAGESMSVSAFDCWVAGLKFPANRKRQEIIAQVIGGPCGEAIRNLSGPAFRGYRRRVATEEERMVHGPTHGGQHRGRAHARKYDTVSLMAGDVRRNVPQITCAQCGKTETLIGRRGKMEDDQLFQLKGWETGDSAARDFCPSCVKARKVVVKMEDHVKKTEATPASAISREDGRILSRLIEDHWDEMNARYLPSWSDMRLAQDVGKPVEWVKEIRERDFGGVGEDPQLTDFLAATIVVTEELNSLHGHMEGLAASVSELTSQHDKVQRLLEKYRDTHNALHSKVKRLGEVADHLRPFDKRASA